MKTFIFALASILLLQAVSARSVASDDTKKTCEDFLKAETCTTLRNVAKTFHENVQIVNDAVVAAYAQHKENAKDMIKFVREYMVQRATTFKCEDVMSADQCTALKAQAAKFKVSTADLLEDIKDAVALGKIQGLALYQKSIEIMLEKLELLKQLKCEDLTDAQTCATLKALGENLKLSTDQILRAAIDAYSKGLTKSKDFLNDVRAFMKSEVSCDDILGADRCDKLKAAAAAFHENAQIINEAIVEAYFQHKENVVEQLRFVREYMVKRATNFKCEDVMSADQCAALKVQAAKFKVSAAELLEDIKEAYVDTVFKGKDLFQDTKEIMLLKLDQLKKLTCEDLTDADTCNKIRTWVNNLGLQKDMVMKAAIDAYSKGFTSAKDILADAYTYLTDELSCDKVIGADKCEEIRALAKTFGVKFDKVLQNFRQQMANGRNIVRDWYQIAYKYVLDNWSIFSDEEMDQAMDIMMN